MATKFNDRTKHVRIQFNFVREAVKNQDIILQNVAPKEMIAEILTKSLSRERHAELIRALEIREIP